MIRTKKLNLLLSCAFLSCICLTSCGCPHDGTKTFVSDTATCEQGGTATYVCGECGKTITEESYALGHDFSIFISDSATCTKDGYKTYQCSRCDKTKTTLRKLLVTTLVGVNAQSVEKLMMIAMPKQ